MSSNYESEEAYYAEEGQQQQQQQQGGAAAEAPAPVDRNVRRPWNETRYSEMDAKTKAEVRKQERDFKKDRDRTMGYFNSVSKAIADVTAAMQDGSMDQTTTAAAFHAIADGFLTEFQKKLKLDVTIFRNSSACRVMETVCTKCDLVQTKTFMYILLGKVGDLMHSPTASFVFETILAALYRNLGLVMSSNASGGDDMLGELSAAEAGAAGHGLPPTQDLLASWVEEAIECMGSLVVDVPGSRSLRTMLMMLSGKPIRGVALPPNPPSFPDMLYNVAEAATAAIESVYTGAAEAARLAAEAGEDPSNPYRKPVKGNVSVSEAWYNACCANTTGAVVQALLQVDAEDSLSNKLNRMYLRGSSVMTLLLDNIVGARVVQSLVRNANAVYGNNANANKSSADGGEEEGGADEDEAAALARWERVLDMVLNHPKLEEVIATPGAVIEKLSYESPEAAAAAQAVEEAAAEEAQLTSSYNDAGNANENADEEGYGASYEGAGEKRAREDDANAEGSGHNGKYNNGASGSSTNNSGLNVSVSPLFFLIQDLITYCPDAAHLETLWNDLLSPRLNALVSNAEYGAILTRFTRKCAFHGLNALEEDGANSSNKPSNHIQQGQLEEPNVKSDIACGAKYFVVPAAFKESIVNEVCRALKQRCTKGAAQALMVEKVLGDTHSACISYNMLSMGAKPSAHFFNAVDKLKVDDLIAASTSAAGACVFQRFILTAAAKDALSSNSTGANKAAAAAAAAAAPIAADGSSAPQQQVKKDSGSLIRFIRRLSPHLPTLVANKYAGYIVECAYEQASIDGKEEIAKNLSEFYLSLVNEDKTVRSERNGGAVGFGAVNALDPISRSIAKKVMVKCCVEQYVHRRADWVKFAERQSNVKRMMMQILANDTI